MKKQDYLSPEAKIVKMETTDVICASGMQGDPFASEFTWEDDE